MIHNPWPGVIEAYRARLPVTATTPIITLLEGNTPLVRADRLARALGTAIELYLKCEGLNPTGSFKDRGMTLAMSQAAERGARAVLCASTGNTSASAADYAARAGLRCIVLLPAKHIALGKLAQAVMHGAEIVPLQGGFDEALQLVRTLGQRPEIEVVNSINPIRIEGQKTAAFEICDILRRAPDFHFLPVGNAGNITAYWKGYLEYFNDKVIKNRTKMMGFQASGASPIVDGKIVEHPQTIATAIRIGNPASWEGATRAAQESGGLIDKVSDEAILEAHRLLARLEGIFVEPASAAPLAGLKKLCQAGKIPPGSRIAVTLTGHGLKDQEAAMTGASLPPAVPATEAAVLQRLGL